MHRIRIPETPGDRHPTYDPVIITVTWHHAETTVTARWNGKLLGQISFPFMFYTHSISPATPVDIFMNFPIFAQGYKSIV